MKQRSNFTLIELVVAIAILAVVAGIIGMAGVSFYDGYKRAVNTTTRLKQFMAIDNLMDTHIRNMVPFKWKDEDGSSRLLFNGEENQIFFTTLRRSYGDNPGALLFVRVFVEEEKLIVRHNISGERTIVKPIMKAEEILEARKVIRQVYLDEKIEKYIVDIVFATRYPEKYDLKELKSMIGFGGSPRASISLALAARSYAFIKHRGYVIPEDVRAVAHDVLRHRIGLTYEAEASDMTADEIISQILNKVEVP